MHIIMTSGPSADIHSALMVYEAGWELDLLTAKNSDGLTPMQIAKSSSSEYLVTFMDDAWQYVHFPRWVPIVVSALLIILSFTAIHHAGLSYGVLIIFVLYAIWSKLAQSMIVSRLSRQSNGLAWGIIVTIIGSYYALWIDLLPSYLFYIVLSFTVIISTTFYLSAVISPVTLNSIIENPNSARYVIRNDMIRNDVM